MERINLFFILGSEPQTRKYAEKLARIQQQFDRGSMVHHTTLEDHYFLLSHHFRLRNFYDHRDRIETFENPVIYHLPFGKDHETGVEKELLRFKGTVPIVMRSYDPHSPWKTSTNYMEKYHDLTITYLRERVNDKNIRFGNCCYDNHLFGTRNRVKEPKHVICAVARNRKGDDYERSTDEFSKEGLTLQKAYRLRDEFVNLEGLDVYGQGWPPRMKNYKGMLYPFDQKYALLRDYRYTLILENAITDNWLSEKVLDAFLTDTVPVYLGSPAVQDHIPPDTFVDLREFSTLSAAIASIHGFSEEDYELLRARIRAVRDEVFDFFSTENTFSRILYEWYNETYGTQMGPTDDEYDAIERRLRSVRVRESNKMLSELIRRGTLIKQQITGR